MVKKRWIAFLLFALTATLFVSWPFQKKRPFLRIPIMLVHGQPCVPVKIEEKSYIFHFDSGASDYFSMNHDVLQEIISKRYVGLKTWHDIKGYEYTTPIYAIDKVNVDEFQIVNCTAVEESRDFLFSGSQISTCSRSNEAIEKELLDIAGRLGPKTLRILDYWLIDLPNSSLVVFRNFEKMRGYLEGLVEVPLEKINPHIVVSVHTDIGVKKLAIDTGAFHSVLFTSDFAKELKTKELVIGGRNFGSFHFFLVNTPKKFPFDGVLGRDFLKNHQVYLDFELNRSFISFD